LTGLARYVGLPLGGGETQTNILRGALTYGKPSDFDDSPALGALAAGGLAVERADRYF
jgi:hypothetical protein